MKTKGARNVLDRLNDLWQQDTDLETRARGLIAEAHKLAIYNPPFAKKALEQLEQIEIERARIRTDVRTLIKEKVEPYMERANPTTDARLAELESRMSDVEHKLGLDQPHMRVVKTPDKQRGSSG